jgi:hypothetical protein
MVDPAILLLVLAFAAGLTLALYAGLIGIPLALLLTSWFFKYAYALLDDVAFGAGAAPVLSLEMVNPVSQRPLGQLAIVLAAYALALWVDGSLRVALLLFFVCATPASIAILGASGKLIQAANPLAWLAVMRALGMYYAALVLFVAAGAALLTWIGSTGLWLAAKLALTMWLTLGFFNAVGAALYERRERLDLDVMRSPERDAEREETEHVRLRARMLDEVYAQVRVRKYAGLETALTQWFETAGRERTRGDALEILRTIAGWGDGRALAAAAQLCIARLHTARLIAEALEAWELALKHDPAFRPAPPERAAELLELAALAGKRALARTIAASR